jgi:hypothetical protein
VSQAGLRHPGDAAYRPAGTPSAAAASEPVTAAWMKVQQQVSTHTALGELELGFPPNGG